MTDDELLRYSRHILLNDIGIEGQNRLQQAHVLIIGLGGLGSPAALYLGAAGIGHLTLVDPDKVELTNLQRQIAHSSAALGQPKVISTATAIHALNPTVNIQSLQQRADAQTLDAWVAAADVVLDCSDNFATRQLINAACFRAGKPLVSGAAIGFSGQISVFDPRQADSPCYACLYPANSSVEEVSCATLGVFAPLVGIVGSTQAAEALKLLVPCGTPLTGRLLMLDARQMRWDEMHLDRQVDCPVCRHRHRHFSTSASA